MLKLHVNNFVGGQSCQAREPMGAKWPGALLLLRCRVLAPRNALPHRLGQEPTRVCQPGSKEQCISAQGEIRISEVVVEVSQPRKWAACPAPRCAGPVSAQRRAAATSASSTLVHHAPSIRLYRLKITLCALGLLSFIRLWHQTSPCIHIFPKIWSQESIHGEGSHYLIATHSLCMYLNGQTLYTSIIDSNKAINTSMWG